MKKKLIENTPPVKPKNKGWQITIQEIGEILVINAWYDKKLHGRHAVNVKTYDHATWSEKDKTWMGTKVESVIGMSPEEYGQQYWTGSYSRYEKERWIIGKKDDERIRELFPVESWKSKESTLSRIADKETELGQKRRRTAEERRQNRVWEMMMRVPGYPGDWAKWMDEKLTHGERWILKSKVTGDFHCAACGGTFSEWPEWDKLKDNQKTACPLCGEPVKIRKRKTSVEIEDRACLIQPIDDEVSVARHFRIKAEFYPVKDGCLEISSDEEIRIILFKEPDARRPRKCDIYYYQWSGFDNRGNPTNRRTGFCHLYDGGIEEAFKGTAYEPVSRIFGEFARAGLKMDYNTMMIGAEIKPFVSLLEMLFRGRFHNLLQEESSSIGWWSEEYRGVFNLDGSSIEEIFRIDDRQKINRIRDRAGGYFMLSWMRWSDENEAKVTDEELIWLERNGIWPESAREGLEVMSVSKLVNYLKRQMKESYPGKKGKAVLEQYKDYLAMCKKLRKKINDEMVFRPRELKRRHDEAVLELEMRAAEIEAESYSAKYGEAEEVLQRVRPKFEYAGEGFMITVPMRIVDIVKEGRALHHCAGATDRYFDRIKQNETYICFLRKTEAPEQPFYTIEVEPGGTIRQHRGMFDEEPEIETVKPFLQEWQKVIRKRMKKEDHELAAVSKEKREANIEELKAKNNTRVLQGLMEDFMEAM